MERFQKLANGATVVAWRGDYVLCHWSAGGKDEFVTWRLSPTGDTVWGHYFKGTPEGLAMALDDLIGRAQ